MNLDHNFVQVWKISEDHKKSKWNTLFPKFRWRPKKKVFIKNRTLFPQIQVKIKKNQKGLHQKYNTFFTKFRWRPKKKRVFNKNSTLFSSILRSDVHSFKLFRRIQPNYSGGYIHPLFRHPCWQQLFCLIVWTLTLNGKRWNLVSGVTDISMGDAKSWWGDAYLSVGGGVPLTI